MRALRAGPSWAEFLYFGVGVVGTVMVSYLSVRNGAEIGVGFVAALALFVAAVIGFAVYPHWTVAATIALFAIVPALKVFVAGEIGAIKDLIVVAAVCAGVILFLFERREPDRMTLVLVALLLVLYVLNPAGDHGFAWAQGVRLVAEPLLLLLVGQVLPGPRRTFRWAMISLITVGCAVAAYGILQQLIGKWALVDLGYSFEAQIRSVGSGALRSFGTLDDPFAYAALLSFGLVAVFFWLRRGVFAWTAAALLLVGLGFSFVRTAILVLIALGGLAVTRRGHAVSGLLAVAGIVIASLIVLVNANGSKSQTYSVTAEGGGSANVILNGRISAWEAALGSDPADWTFGRGVGEVGTAAARARYTLAPSTDSPEPGQLQAVDSGYLAAIADTGLAGLAVLLTLFYRLISIAIDAARQRQSPGWVALGLLAVLLLDATSRSSFTGFPTAFLGLLLVGICIGAAREDSSHSSERRAAEAG